MAEIWLREQMQGPDSKRKVVFYIRDQYHVSICHFYGNFQFLKLLNEATNEQHIPFENIYIVHTWSTEGIHPPSIVYLDQTTNF